jgi:hypothetical protein
LVASGFASRCFSLLLNLGTGGTLFAGLDFVRLLRESLSVEKDLESCEDLLSGEDEFFGGTSNAAFVGRFDSLLVIVLDNDELLLLGRFSSFSESVLRLNGDDRRTMLDALPSVSTKPSAAVFFFAGDGDREFGIHDLRLNLAERWFVDSVVNSWTSSLSAEAGVLNMGAVNACSALLSRCMTLSAVASFGSSFRRFSAGDLSLPLSALREGAASDSGVESPDDTVETSSTLFSSMDEESRVSSLLVVSDCVSCAVEKSL